MRKATSMVSRACNTGISNFNKHCIRPTANPQLHFLHRISTFFPLYHEKDVNKTNQFAVEDDVYEGIAGTRITWKPDRKPWVGFNPFKKPISSDWMSFLSQKIDWDTFIEDKLEDRAMAKLRAMQE